MAQVSCGTVLRKAREKKGYDLDYVARRLRIRPDILRAIENSDFANMPPRGYTRNMINAYARLLGLNPTETVNMYLDDMFANQVKRTRSSATQAFEVGHEKRFSRDNAHNAADEDEQRSSRRSARKHDGIRDLYDDRTEYARRGYGVDDGREEREDDWRSPNRTAARAAATSSSRPSARAEREGRDARESRDQRSYSDRTRRGSSRNGAGYQSSQSASILDTFGSLASSLGGNHDARGGRGAYSNYNGNMYSGGSSNSGLVGRMPVIIAALVALIVIIIVLSVVIGGRNSAATDVSTLPVTGIADTTTDDDATEVETTKTTELAPTSAQVKYEVKSGQSAYVEIYQDGGDAEPKMLTGPTSESVEVTGTWTIATWAKDAITLTVDGETVDLATSSDYGGMYAYTVDFNQILDNWNKEHGTSKTSSSSSSSGTTSGSSASSSSSSAASGSSTSGSGTSTTSSTAGSSNSSSQTGTTNSSSTTTSR